MLPFNQKFFLSKLISGTFGRFLCGNGSHILMYHSIVSGDSTDCNDIYKINKKDFFLQQTKLASMKNIEVVSLEKMSGKSNEVAITFDDGFRDTYEIATPILEELGLPFTVFVTPGFIEKEDRNFLSKQLLLSLSKISGCTIGAHSYSHCRLTECSDSMLDNELSDSKKWLEDVIGEPVNMMSYPHGAVNKRVRDAAEKAGYKIAASSKAGANSMTQDMLQLSRTDIWSMDNIQTFTKKINGNWDWI